MLTTDKKVKDAISLLTRLGYTITPPNIIAQSTDDALNVWLAYKKEKGQTYKPRGLAALKTRLDHLSGGDADKAMEIVNFSMANNYVGLFAPKQYINGRNDADNIRSKVGAILAE